MADKRAIDKLKEAFCVDNVSRYIIKKEGVVILEIYWKPLTIADRDTIYKTLHAMNKANETDNLEKFNSPYALSKYCMELYAKLYYQLLNQFFLKYHL